MKSVVKKINFSIKAFFAILLFCYSAGGAGALSLTLTIDDAVKLAKDNNITIKKEELTLKDLKTKKNTSWNSVSPSLALNGGYTNDFENSTERLNISAQVNIALSANLATNIIVARENYAKGVITFSQCVRDVERNVRKSFTQLLYQKEYCALEDKYLETAKAQYDTNRLKFSKGQITQLDVATSRLNWEKQKPESMQAKSNYENMLATFKKVLGIAQDTDIQIVGTLDEALLMDEVTMESLPKVTSPAPSVLLGQKNLAIAKATLANTRASSYSPVISAGYTYGEATTLDTDINTTTNTLSLSVKVPLDGYLPWSGGGVSIKTQKRAVKKEELALKDTEEDVAVQTANLIRTINQARAQGSVAKQNATLSATTYELTRQAYNYGKTDIIALQKAGDEVLDAQVKVKNCAYTLISSVLDLEYLLGIPYGAMQKKVDTEGEGN